MKIPCLSISQVKGTGKFWLCKVKVKDIIGKCLVDRQAPEKPKGYQRDVVKSRARRFGRFMQSGNICPVNLLINIRGTGVVEENGFLNVPEKLDWWIVDGQHRFEGLKLIIEEGNDKSLRELELPIALTNMNKNDEARQFLIINKLHKGVRTDLAERILLILQEEEGKESTINLPIESWKAEALKVVDLLADDPESPLSDLIKKPGDKGMKPLKQVSVTDSLKPVIDIYRGYLKNEDRVAKALMNMWGAVKEICPECFDEPKDYHLLKTTGVFVMHKLFAELLPTLASGRDMTKGRYFKILTHYKIKEYFSPEYWRSDNNDGVSKYGTGRKSFSLINDLIWDSVQNVIEDVAPEPDTVEI